MNATEWHHATSHDRPGRSYTSGLAPTIASGESAPTNACLTLCYNSLLTWNGCGMA